MNKSYFCLSSKSEFLRIDVDKAIYFEAYGNDTNVVLLNQLKNVVRMNLVHVQQSLCETLKDRVNVFVRVGKKHIVNHTYICKIDLLSQKLILSDGVNFVFQLEVSKEALRNLKRSYLSK